MLPDDPGKFRQDVQSPLKADILAYRGDFPMKIKRIDHVVLTTGNLEKCLTFYAGLLGMEHQEKNGRHALLFGAQKFNIHTRKGEFQPAAENPTEGSIDICLVVEGSIEEIAAEIKAKGQAVELGIVKRTGALGPIDSIYLRDPDGNLVELCVYQK